MHWDETRMDLLLCNRLWRGLEGHVVRIEGRAHHICSLQLGYMLMGCWCAMVDGPLEKRNGLALCCIR